MNKFNELKKQIEDHKKAINYLTIWNICFTIIFLLVQFFNN